MSDVRKITCDEADEFFDSTGTRYEGWKESHAKTHEEVPNE